MLIMLHSGYYIIFIFYLVTKSKGYQRNSYWQTYIFFLGFKIELQQFGNELFAEFKYFGIMSLFLNEKALKLYYYFFLNQHYSIQSRPCCSTRTDDSD